MNKQYRNRVPWLAKTGPLLLLVALVALLPACRRMPARADAAELAQRPIRVTVTTSIMADIVRQVGGERVEVTALMGTGVDPHLYKAREGDVLRLVEADLILSHGLHLESKMGDVLAEMDRWVVSEAVCEVLRRDRLIYPEAAEGNPDPHVWFDVQLWTGVVEEVGRVLAEVDPVHATTYRDRTTSYVRELYDLDAYVRAQAERVPRDQRVLITAHDAFGYFARAYGFEVRGLQGISTVDEAGILDVQQLASFIADRQIPAIFVESSVPVRNVEAVKEAVRSRGWQVEIGGELFSDSLGNPGSPEGTYIGTVRHNIDIIVAGLLGEARSH